MKGRALTAFHLFSSAKFSSSPREVLVSPQKNPYFPRLNISRFRRLSGNHCQFSAAFPQNHQHFKEKNEVRGAIYSKCSYFLWCKLDTVENLEPEPNRNDLEVPGSNPPPSLIFGGPSLPPVGIFNKFLSNYNICLLISVSTISAAVLNTSTLT